MNSNSKWALAIVVVVAIVFGAIAIGTRDDGKNEVGSAVATTAATGATKSTSAKSDDDPGSSKNSSKSAKNSDAGSDGGSGSKDNSSASPKSSEKDSSDSSPKAPVRPTPGNNEASLGSSDVVSPILTEEKVRTVRASKGDVVTLRGYSPSNGEMHVHGYNKEYLLDGNSVTKIKFKATIDGVFVIEFHLPDGSNVEVGTLRVSP